VLFEWLRIAIRNRYESALRALEKFLSPTGVANSSRRSSRI
jgi:hypothetical protein